MSKKTNIENLTYESFKKLPQEKLNNLKDEIRKYIIEVVTKNGGHLSSNLGNIELIMALHYVFDFQNNYLIFDIGHQAYTHKIITNRASVFKSLRKPLGISGFINENESCFDHFSTGHAGLSIGYALSKSYLTNKFSVAFLGDGAFCNCINLSGLNFLDKISKNILLVINNNKMNISPSYGRYYDILNDAEKAKAFFSLFNIEAIYQEDGNNLDKIIGDLKKIKPFSGPYVYICNTKKNKGKDFKDSEKMHAIAAKPLDNTWPLLVSDCLKEYITNKTYIVQSGMTQAFFMHEIKNIIKDRYLDFGMNEELAVNFADGLSEGDNEVIIPLYATFMQRAYDQIINDIARKKKKVLFLVNRIGLIDGDDSTHQGIYAANILKTCENIKIFYPYNKASLKDALDYFYNKNNKKAVAICYSKEPVEKNEYNEIDKGYYKIARKGFKATVITYSNLYEKNYKELLKLDITLINYFIHDENMDKKDLYEEAFKNDKVILFTEEIEKASPLLEIYKYKQLLNSDVKIECLCIKQKVAPHNIREQLLKNNNLTILDIKKIIN